MLVGCVTVTTTNNPTMAPDWHLYGGIEIGAVVALPASWRAFDLDKEIEQAANACSSNPAARDALRPNLERIHAGGVRLLACDTGHLTDLGLVVAYASKAPVPDGGVDKYLDDLKQGAGREVLERKHVSANAGDMIVQRVRERVAGTNGTVSDTTHYQFLVIRFNAMQYLIVEVPTALVSAVGADVERIGTSFTPLR